MTNISLKEVSVFLMINIILLLLGIIIWYYMWVKKYGIEIPNKKSSSVTVREILESIPKRKRRSIKIKTRRKRKTEIK